MIYYAEDDRGIRELVVYTLKNTGFEAEGFSDGKELIEAMSKRTPELVLLDIMMPGEDGIEILRKLKSSPTRLLFPTIRPANLKSL